MAVTDAIEEVPSVEFGTDDLRKDDSSTPPPKRRWSREEYNRAAEVGIFQPHERLELIDGEVFTQVSPQNSPHAWSILLTAEALRSAFGEGYLVREEKPLLFSEVSEPEPDIAVVKGKPSDFRDHPTPDKVVLVVEVSDTTYSSDSRFKSSHYASAGIPDYWVLNIKKRALEVRSTPSPDPKARFGWSYAEVKIYGEDGTIAPLGAPDRNINVRDLLFTPMSEEGDTDADNTG